MIVNFDLNKLNGIMEDVYTWDYPDFCDAFLSEATYDGRELSEEECMWITETYPEWINESAYQSLI